MDNPENSNHLVLRRLSAFWMRSLKNTLMDSKLYINEGGKKGLIDGHHRKES